MAIGRAMRRRARALAILGPALLLMTLPARAAGDRALGAYLASECTACHQVSGQQTGAIPAIIGLPADQFVALMDTYKQRQRESDVMRTIAARLSVEEIEALAAYFGSIKPAQ